MLAAIVTTGRRTTSNLLRLAGELASGHPSSYHRVFSHRRWSLWPLARAMAALLLQRFVPEGPVVLAGDDTVEEHRGDKVYGKACHRDAVRSSHSQVAYRWGHKWVVLSVLVRFPFASRPWALPILVALYQSKGADRAEGRRHKTPPELMRQLLAALLRWFPQRRFVLAADGGYATHDLVRFAFRHSRSLTLVSRFYADARLYRSPSKCERRRGHPPIRGARLPSPRRKVATAKRTPWTVAWYGGGTRRIEGVSETGGWYRAGAGLVPVRWVFVHDLTGTHRDEYFFCTDPGMTPQEIAGIYTGRWSIETTFQEIRPGLGFGTTRCRTRRAVLRTAPAYSDSTPSWRSSTPRCRAPRGPRPGSSGMASSTSPSRTPSPPCAVGSGVTGFSKRPTNSRRFPKSHAVSRGSSSAHWHPRRDLQKRQKSS